MDSSLCSVCVEADFKYKCPVCSAKTCSLVCSKRHKLRSSCQGQHRPSAFKSKPDLHRPTQLAADFDFLNSIQRSLDRAIDSHGPSPSKPPPLDRRIRESCDARGLVILPAPLQSSRACQNHTFCSPDNRIIWTIEWVYNASTIATVQVDEGLTINDAFENHVLPSLKTSTGTGPHRIINNPFSHAKTPLDLLYHLRSIEPQSQTVTLFPLAAHDTLSNALINATILEFPTIQVSISHE